MKWITQHKTTFIIAIVLVVLAVWYGLSSSAPPAPLLTTDTTSTGSPSADSADQQMVATLLALRAVTLSGTIFSDPAFTSLRDFGTTIVPEPIGRINPFAPLTAGSSASSTNTRSTQLFSPTH